MHWREGSQLSKRLPHPRQDTFPTLAVIVSEKAVQHLHVLVKNIDDVDATHRSPLDPFDACPFLDSSPTPGQAFSYFAVFLVELQRRIHAFVQHTDNGDASGIR